MRIPRVYTPSPLTPNTSLTLDDKTAHYLGKVLRMKAGRELILFNGKGGEYPTTLLDISKKEATVTLGNKVNVDRESNLHSHLAIGLSRGERWDLVLQKATELGVTEITPLLTERGEVKLTGERLEKKFQHWQGIIISACEQCQRNKLPILHTPTQYDTFIAQGHSGTGLVLHHRSEKTLQSFSPDNECTLLVGPEGGLTENEIDLAHRSGFESLTLGPRVLRTETAPLAALTALQLYWGDF